MKISKNGIDFIANHEGFRANAYDDLQPNVRLTASTMIKGTLTIGYGTIRYANGARVKWNDTITKEKAKKLLKTQIEQHCSVFKKAITIQLTQNQYDALASFSYNLGANAITNNKTLLNAINGKNWSVAVAQMKLYNKSGGKVLQGLVSRRKAETDLFMNGLNSITKVSKSRKMEDKNMTLKIGYDAGHGHNTPGKRSPDGEREWDFNNTVAKSFHEELSKYSGVELKRFDDSTGKTDVGLKKRTDGANNWGADYYISFHHNANTSKWGNWGGVETFVYTTASQKTIKYANAIHSALVKGYGLTDRGVKKQNLHICRETKMPAILVEGGFMDSKTDIKVLRDSAKLKKAGKEIAQAFVKFFGLKLKSTSSTGSTNQNNTSSKKTNTQIAKEVIAGKWGNGDARKNALKKAGYDPNTIQKVVNSLL